MNSYVEDWEVPTPPEAYRLTVFCDANYDDPAVIGEFQQALCQGKHLDRQTHLKTLDQIRPINRFNESFQDTVPQAILAFLESADFEDAIRNAISLGGDGDTLAAITGSIAEAAYRVPGWIKDKALSYLNTPLRNACAQWDPYLGNG